MVQTKGGDSLVEQDQVYGSGKFGEAGVRAGLEYDSRGRSVGMTELRGMAAPDATAAAMAPPVTGVRLLAEGFFSVRRHWDVHRELRRCGRGASRATSATSGLALATRVGGRATLGAYPWFESAKISGEVHDVRGYYNGRYRGNSALYGDAKLRWWIGKRKGAVLPVRWGLSHLRRVRPRLVRGRRTTRSGTPATAWG